MTSVESPKPLQPAELAPETVVRLRHDPPRVTRLSRRVIVSAAGIASAVVIATAVYALLPEQDAPPRELFKTGAVALPEQLTSGPRDYGGAPKLGPPPARRSRQTDPRCRQSVAWGRSTANCHALVATIRSAGRASIHRTG